MTLGPGYMYRINPKYLDRQAWANSVDTNQTLYNTMSDLCLYFLPLIEHLISIWTDSPE